MVASFLRQKLKSQELGMEFSLPMLDGSGELEDTESVEEKDLEALKRAEGERRDLSKPRPRQIHSFLSHRQVGVVDSEIRELIDRLLDAEGKIKPELETCTRLL